jgi:hypothetical protein
MRLSQTFLSGSSLSCDLWGEVHRKELAWWYGIIMCIPFSGVLNSHVSSYLAFTNSLKFYLFFTCFNNYHHFLPYYAKGKTILSLHHSSKGFSHFKIKFVLPPNLRFLKGSKIVILKLMHFSSLLV